MVGAVANVREATIIIVRTEQKGRHLIVAGIFYGDAMGSRISLTNVTPSCIKIMTKYDIILQYDTCESYVRRQLASVEWWF